MGGDEEPAADVSDAAPVMSAEELAKKDAEDLAKKQADIEKETEAINEERCAIEAMPDGPEKETLLKELDDKKRELKSIAFKKKLKKKVVTHQ